MLLVLLVLSTSLCEAEITCDDEKCVASAQLVQKKKMARHVSNIEEIAEAVEGMAEPDEDKQTGKTRLLEENKQKWFQNGKVSDLPSNFYESWRNTCSGYEYHSEWCRGGCYEGREIENEYTRQVCSDGKLKVVKVKKGTSCTQDYVKFQCQATKAKVITVKKQTKDLLYVRPRTDPDEILNCGKNAAAVEMGLNDRLTGYWFDGSKNARIWKTGAPVKIRVTVMFGRKLQIYGSGDMRWGKRVQGWDTDLKLVCLPYVPKKPEVRNDQMMVPPPDLGSWRCVIPDKPCSNGKEWKIDNQKLGFATNKPTGWLCIKPKDGNPGAWKPMKEQYRVRCKSPPPQPFWTKCYKNEDCHKWGNYGNKRDNCIASDCKDAGLKWKGEWYDCGKDSRDLWWHFKGKCV